MALSYKNLISNNQLLDILNTGNFSKESLNKSFKKSQSNAAKYINGYAQDSAIEALANSLNINKSLFRQMFGLEDKKLDAYDPYHLSDSKKEEFWFLEDSNREEGRRNGLVLPELTEKVDGKEIQKRFDNDTNIFKRGLYSQFDFRQNDFWYEDPFIPSFEIFMDENSAFFAGDNDLNSRSDTNSFKYFIQKYIELDTNSYLKRFEQWSEFKNILFKLFERDLKESENRNQSLKTYYISKISGLNNLNKKIINYGEDKISITINEDVAMIAWYLSELYNNIVYNYKHQRYAVPENVIRFNMSIQINDIRNYQIPQSNNSSSENVPVDRNYIQNRTIKNTISPKSKIVYTLHDCNFNFFESRNYGDDLEIGGYGGNGSFSPQSLTFDVYFKSVTRYSDFPLILNNNQKREISAWKSDFYGIGSKQNYYDNLDRIKYEGGPEKKGFMKQNLGKLAQNVANVGLDYLDNLETKLREVRGGAVNSLLEQFRNLTKINKIEPDNVYAPDFNNRLNVKNLARSVGAELQNQMEDIIRNSTNF